MKICKICKKELVEEEIAYQFFQDGITKYCCKNCYEKIRSGIGKALLKISRRRKKEGKF